jgi:tRNA pseudouridine55 synthase
VLLLDKPLGLSSNQALQKAKWLLQAEKAGHTGTLDPLATGVLPLCFGAATKFSQMHLDADKVYVAQVRLGITTSTADAEGEVLQEQAVAVSLAQVEAVLQRFTGALTQVPPMYSALKKDGRPLYEYARAGQEVERTARAVTVHSLRLLRAELDGAAPTIEIAVDCSKGTYIRTLGEDIGLALGCGAHLSALRRSRTGGFGEAQTVSLQALEAMPPEARLDSLMPPDCLLAGHALVTLDADNAARFLSGMRRRGTWPDADAVAVYADAPRALLGTGHVKAGELIPVRLLSPLEIGQYQAQMSLIEGSKLVV